jgi:hypothetical protein
MSFTCHTMGLWIGVTLIDVWMDGWADGWMSGWMDERMDGWADGWMSEWMDERMDGWADGWMSGWMEERMGGGKEGQTDDWLLVVFLTVFMLLSKNWSNNIHVQWFKNPYTVKPNSNIILWRPPPPSTGNCTSLNQNNAAVSCLSYHEHSLMVVTATKICRNVVWLH